MRVVIGMPQLFMVRDKDFSLTTLLARYVDALMMATRSESLLDELRGGIN